MPGLTARAKFPASNIPVGKIGGRKFAAIVLAALSLASAGPTLAQGAIGSIQSEVVSYIGVDNSSGGAPNQYFGGVTGSFYLSNGFGLHLETTGQWPADAARFVSIGVSGQATPSLRPMIFVGTSNDDQGFLPETYIAAALEIDFRTIPRTLGRVGINYRQYRQSILVEVNGIPTQIVMPGAKIIGVEGEIARFYRTARSGNYTIGQLRASASWADPGSYFGWEVSGGGTYVTRAGWSAGLRLAIGEIGYDPQIQTGFGNKFAAIRPYVSYTIRGGTELFLSGEYVNSEFYNLTSGMVGVKIRF